jgi:hypothetical protein
MERQTEGKTTFPPFARQLIDRGRLEGLRDGELKGLRGALLRLVAWAGLALDEILSS